MHFLLGTLILFYIALEICKKVLHESTTARQVALSSWICTDNAVGETFSRLRCVDPTYVLSLWGLAFAGCYPGHYTRPYGPPPVFCSVL